MPCRTRLSISERKFAPPNRSSPCWRRWAKRTCFELMKCPARKPSWTRCASFELRKAPLADSLSPAKKDTFLLRPGNPLTLDVDPVIAQQLAYPGGCIAIREEQTNGLAGVKPEAL